jgi:hypothetical protein
MTHTPIRLALAGALLATATLSGCATQGPHEHPELLSRIQAAERAAADAQQAAARAQARADEAAAASTANTEKIDKAFRKSQQK